MGDKFVDTLSSKGVNFGEQNNPHQFPLPYIQSWGVCSSFLQAQ